MTDAQMSSFLLFTLFGFLSGITTALFGFGGGFVVVPLIFQFASHALTLSGHPPDTAMKVAVATSASVMIFGSLMATVRHHRLGSLDWALLRPLFVPIGVGATVGAYTTVLINGMWLRWAFIGYLAATLLDSIFRPGFLHCPIAGTESVFRRYGAFIGFVVGWISALLGVGGSVMTVPMLRRSGVSMARSTAMANPLTLSVALCASATHAALSWVAVPSIGDGFLGYIDIQNGSALAMGVWFGIELFAPLAKKIEDHVHATAYVVMLAVVLLGMLIAR